MGRFLGSMLVLGSLALGACGGGGDAGTSDPGGAGTSGLVPAAGAVGQVLFAKATDIRPVVPGAQWTYHGYEHAGAGSSRFTVTASAVAGGVLETELPSGSGVALVVDPATQSVTFKSPFQLFPTSPPLEVAGYEVRSPVRVNDQYVLLDRHVDDSGTDLDGDGKNDAVDVALWRVVGPLEAVTMLDNTRFDAVRIDTHIAIRVLPSGGAPAQTISSRQSNWYAPGIGGVRTAIYSTKVGQTFDYEAWLTGFDAPSTGWGVTVRPLPFDAGVVDAIQDGDGLLLLTTSGLARLGKDGRVVAAPPNAPFSFLDGGKLRRTSAGLVNIVSSSYIDRSVRWLKDDGSVDTSRPSWSVDRATFGSAGTFLLLSMFDAAPTGDRFWAVWTRTTFGPNGSTTNELLARAYALDGVPIGEEISFPTQGAVYTPVARLTPDGGVFVSWQQSSDIYAAARARLDSQGRLMWTLSHAGGDPTLNLVPLFDESDTWLQWSRDVSATGAAWAGGVRLSGTGEFVGAPSDGSAFITEVVALDQPLVEAWGKQSASHGHFFGVGTYNSPLYAHDARNVTHLEYVEFDAGPDRLATGLAESRRIVIEEPVLDWSFPPFVFDDRVLLLTRDSSGLRPAVIWR